MAFRGLRLTGALFALCLVAASVYAEDAPAAAGVEDVKQVFLPTTTNDFGAAIFALLQQQTNFIAAKGGADQEGSPLNILTSLSSWAQEAQTALFQLAAPIDPTTGQADTSFQSFPTTQFYDPLRQLLNVTGSWSDIISRAHIDPVPNNLILALTELPFGPQLDAAVKNLPVLTDPVLLQNATANFGNAVSGIPGLPAVFAKGGAARPIVAGGQVVGYGPCFVSDSAAGFSNSNQLISVVPRLFTSSVTGVAIVPRLIELQPRALYVKPIGANFSPQGINVSPQLIAVSPKVTISYPATPAAAKTAATTGAAPATGRK